MIIIDKAKPEKQILEILKDANTIYDRKISRGSQFKFMWLDGSREVEWAKMLNAKALPKLVVLNPGKRKRFVDYEGAITSSSISKFFNRFNYFSKIQEFLSKSNIIKYLTFFNRRFAGKNKWRRCSFQSNQRKRTR